MNFRNYTLFKVAIYFFVLSSCSYPFESKAILIKGEIGSYLKHVIETNEKTLIKVGNGIFARDNLIFGWPEKSGKFKYRSNNTDYDIIIESKISEKLNINNKTVGIEFTEPCANKVIIEENASRSIIFSDSNYFNWQLSSDENARYFAWIAFNKNTHNHCIFYYDSTQCILRQIEADRKTQYRYPKYTSAGLYYYEEKLQDSGKIISSILKHSITDKTSTVIYTSDYPHNIYSYTITNNNDIIVLQKTDSLYRTRIILISENGIPRFIDLNYHLSGIYNMQKNFYLYSTDLIFAESKNDSISPWQLKKIEVKDNELRIENPGINNYQNQFIDKYYSSPMDYSEMFGILINKHSPPIAGYSFGDNSYGLLSITEAAYMRAIANIATVSSDETWWYILAEKASNIISGTDENIKITDYRGVSGPNWSTVVFSIDKSKYVSYLVHDASILDGLLLIANKLDRDEVIATRFPKLKNKIFDLFKRNNYSQNKFHVLHTNDKYKITAPGESYYVFPYNSPAHKFDGINLPLNMMMAYVRPLITASKLYHNDNFLRDALSIGKLFSRHIIRQNNNTWLWPYWWGLAISGWNNPIVSCNTPVYAGKIDYDVQDIDHGSLDVRGVIALANYGAIFNLDDINALSNSLLEILAKNSTLIPSNVDGSAKSVNNFSKIMLWSELAEYNENVKHIYRKMVKDLPPVYDHFINTARFEILGISHLIKANHIDINANILFH